MSAITIYGIKNCDTMKKAFKWLEENKIDYVFHDYKKQGIDKEIIKQAIVEHGWDTVINRRGTTWRQLPDAVKNSMDDTAALKIAEENPSIVKRPLLNHNDQVCLGFKADTYSAIFK